MRPATPGFREARCSTLNRGAEPDGPRRSWGELGSRLACPLVLKQRGHFVSRVATELEPAAWEYTKGFGSGSPRRRPGRVLRELRFGVSSLPLQPIFRSVSTKHTHTHTLRQHFFWPWLPPGRQKYVGGGDRRWRPDCGLRGCHTLHFGRPGPVFTFQCGPLEWGGRPPRLGRPVRGAPEVPCARQVSAKEPGQRPLLGGDPSPALRWLPAAVYPATAGATRAWGPRGGKDQGAHRTAGLAGSSAWPALAPTHAAARRTGVASVGPAVPPGGQQPGAAASASPGPAPEQGSAGAGVSVCRRLAQEGWSPQSPRKRGLGGRGLVCPKPRL